MTDRSARRSSWSRRRYLGTAGGVAVTGLAGCIAGSSPDGSGGGSADEGPTAVASFFTFYDFARRVAAGTPLSVENLVPTGLHGHGWEPDPTIVRDIIDAEAFIHVGPDFQPWADRAIQVLIDDDADTELINVRENVELIDLVESVGEEEQVGDGRDPHFWLDPTRATAAVDTIAEGFADLLPNHEAAFVENAEGVKEELLEIDAEWWSIFDAAERDVVFLAAHNAFEYVGNRYGATIQPLVVNLAATDDVRPADMRRARETIDHNDIRYIGAAVFEPRRPARQLLEQTSVEAYFPVTPYAGITEEWVELDWGYFEIARNINMKTFEIVLGVSDPEETDLRDRWRNFE